MAFDEVTVARPYDPPTDQRGHSRLVTHKVIRWSRKICDYTPSRFVTLLVTGAKALHITLSINNSSHL